MGRATVSSFIPLDTGNLTRPEQGKDRQTDVLIHASFSGFICTHSVPSLF